MAAQSLATNVVPFQFDSIQIRTVLINDQPWFVAPDVCNALGIKNNRDALARLDDDEKGVANTDTLGGKQEVTIINESGLYSLILTSRKPEAKRFKKWVTAEVLPAIRKTGRYDASQAAIGSDGHQILSQLISQKVRAIPAGQRRRAQSRLWQMVHTRFEVARAEVIPADQLESACNFIAATVLEGLYLPAEPTPEPVRLDYSIEHWLQDNPQIASAQMFQGRDQLYVDGSMLYGMDSRSPTLRLLRQLNKEGHNIEACFMEVTALRHQLERSRNYMQTMQEGITNTLNGGLRFNLRHPRG